MEPRRSDQFQPYIESVENIVGAMKQKVRYVEELNFPDYPNASEVIREKLVAFESMFKSASQHGLDQNKIALTDEQKQIFAKVIEDANRGIESHNLKVLRDSIRDLESFRERIAES